MSPSHQPPKSQLRHQLSIWYGMLKASLGLRMRSEDRDVLEKIILPALAEQSETVLFIGCEWYTKHYSRYFPHQVYWTLEADPAKSAYGSQRHITDVAQNVAQHFPAEALDLIICNGVIGWGLNQPDEIEAACAGFAQCLRPQGILLVGWNDLPDHRPTLPLAEIGSLNLLSPFIFPPLQGSTYRCQGDSRHVFNFYLKGG